MMYGRVMAIYLLYSVKLRLIVMNYKEEDDFGD